MKAIQEHYIQIDNGLEYFTQNHITYTERYLNRHEIMTLSMSIDFIAEMIEKGFIPIVKNFGESSVITFKSKEDERQDIGK